MRSMIVTGALAMSVATMASAQGPSSPTAAPGAEQLLSRVGELQLTDAQVVRLAAIARRAAARRQATRAVLDSARQRFPAGAADTAARRQFSQRMRADMERVREQDRADRR